MLYAPDLSAAVQTIDWRPPDRAATCHKIALRSRWQWVLASALLALVAAASIGSRTARARSPSKPQEVALTGTKADDPGALTAQANALSEKGDYTAAEPLLQIGRAHV